MWRNCDGGNQDIIMYNFSIIVAQIIMRISIKKHYLITVIMNILLGSLKNFPWQKFWVNKDSPYPTHTFLDHTHGHMT